ncbi:hypothetical protein CWM52_01760 [Raoultella sp. T31]|nr:hypothetical protein CWM52_01760 [Raoultella sp. T31]
MLLKNIIFSLLLPREGVKCWLSLSRFSAILCHLDYLCYVPKFSSGDVCNVMIYIMNYQRVHKRTS